MARRNPRNPATAAPAADDATVLVSPRGVPIRVTSRADFYNLLARGYTAQPKVELAEVEQTVVEQQESADA